MPLYKVTINKIGYVFADSEEDAIDFFEDAEQGNSDSNVDIADKSFAKKVTEVKQVPTGERGNVILVEDNDLFPDNEPTVENFFELKKKLNS
jgi:hypothetical protein